MIILGCGDAAGLLIHNFRDSVAFEACFSDALGRPESVAGVPTVSSLEGLSGKPFIVAVGHPRAKEALWDRAIQAGLIPCDPLIHKSAYGHWDDVKLGRGTVIFNNVCVGYQTKIGYGCWIEWNTVIAHHVKIGKHCHIGALSFIPGHTQVKQKAFIGPGSKLMKISVGDEAMVAIGSVVTKDVAPRTIVAGNPARLLEGKDPSKVKL